MTTLRTLAALFALFLIAPSVQAQTASGQIGGANLGQFLESITRFIDDFIIPFIWAIAVLMFVWGIIQYFILGGASEEKRDEGKKLAIWGIVAFFIMTSLWGIVNLFRGTFEFGGDNTPNIPRFDTASQPSGNLGDDTFFQ